MIYQPPRPVAILSLLIFFSLNALQSNASENAGQLSESLGFKILKKVPQSKSLFTQGLVIDKHTLWQSSGLYGKSLLLEKRIPSGKVLSKFTFPDHHFAEGIAINRDKLLGLTWRSHTIYQWDRGELTKTKQFEWHGEGWGLTTWNSYLVSSDGSNRLFFTNINSLELSHTVLVKQNNFPINNLNDLTSDDSSIWSNVWKKNYLLRINPTTGMVTGSLDLTELSEENDSSDPEAVLNGVAWDSSSQSMWVTGKRWPFIYQLKIQTK